MAAQPSPGSSETFDVGGNPSSNFPDQLFSKQDKDLIARKVDSIITYGINMKAFPGAQVLVAFDGDVIFHKTYGYHTYENQRAVGPTDLYDLASVTKIIGPLPAIMKLYEEGKIDLDKPFSTYWSAWENIPDKKDLTLREILAHQAGLKPYIVFLNRVLKKGRLKKRYVSHSLKRSYQKQAYRDLFIKTRFQAKIYKDIDKSEVSAQKSYRYSGLAFLLFPELISQLSGHSFEYYLQKHFYLPLGATGLVFNPLTHKRPNPVVPTEIDTIYRKDLVRGWVHDENASLFGGISGNAGLFGTARDLFLMMELYRNYGTYNDQQFFREETVKEFTSIQFPGNDNRRGLGFDKPLINNHDFDLDRSYPAPEASADSFGHGGFTGTFVWADPKYRMVYIFLSNRVYPSRAHRQLYELHIRTAVQQVFYKALAGKESFN
jgi:CubicO group peptidase (beta-lactamase class C family)